MEVSAKGKDGFADDIRGLYAGCEDQNVT